MASGVEDKHEKVFAVLEKMAEAMEPVSRFRHAAAIVLKGEVLAFGLCRRKSHPFQRRFAKCDDAIQLHAETDALQRVIREYGADILEKSSMYVLRMKFRHPHGGCLERGMSKPCSGCERALAQFNLKNVYYTTEEGDYACL